MKELSVNSNQLSVKTDYRLLITCLLPSILTVIMLRCHSLSLIAFLKSNLV